MSTVGLLTTVATGGNLGEGHSAAGLTLVSSDRSQANSSYLADPSASGVGSDAGWERVMGVLGPAQLSGGDVDEDLVI